MSNGALIAAALSAVAIGLFATTSSRPAEDRALEGADPEPAGRVVPAIEAAFELESYRPGERARLVIENPTRRLILQVLRSGPERVATQTDLEMNGVRVTARRQIGGRLSRRALSLIVGPWPSGLYFARLESSDGRVGYAPFVVGPRRIGRRRVAVVLPTLTWQAYNFRDDDGDGFADSWYAGKRMNSVRLGRPHLDRGVPYGFRYHLGFLNWLAWTGKQVDYLSQLELERVSSPEALARAYDLVIFAGHHEYVTSREYDLVEGYRDLGGNLLFLSANNFFWRVERNDDVIVKASRWRDLGRPEAGLVGVQYRTYQRAPRGSWIVRPSRARSWLFAGTGLRPGSAFSRGGVEIDQITSASPPGVQLVAEIPRLFGPGLSAQMTYYETPTGARVFAAGAFHLTRAITSDPVVWRMLENLWMRLARDE
jgi:N,N-dimethylformamidase beta subunit-like, C-terminal